MICAMTIRELEEVNEKIRHKLPTIDESIRNYEQMVINYKKEKEDLEQTLNENTHVIGLLRHGGIE